MTWYQTQTSGVHYRLVWQFSFDAAGERFFASMWAQLILTGQWSSLIHPLGGYSYAHLGVKISASVSSFVPLEARMHSPRRRASTDIVLVCDRLMVFTGHISVCGLLSGSMLCSNLRKRFNLAALFLSRAPREHRSKKLQSSLNNSLTMPFVAVSVRF